MRFVVRLSHIYFKFIFLSFKKNRRLDVFCPQICAQGLNTLNIYQFLLSAWTIVSLYNIAGADAKEDFSFVDENNDNSMSWGEVSQESYDIDPDDNDSFAKEIEENSDSFRVIFRKNPNFMS